MLDVDSAHMSFGGVAALTDVSFSVGAGEVVGVIGPNGSGKSTLINVMSGFYRPTKGTISLGGTVISGRSPEAIRRAGLARTFQNLRLVAEMTVLDNALAGTFLGLTDGGPLTPRWIADVLGSPGARRRSARMREHAEAALAKVGLGGRLGLRAGVLSYADQKRLELARAIALRPRVLVLDEPTAGMSVEDADEMVRMVTGLARDGEEPLSLFLVEHRLELVLEVSDRVVVMDGGRLVADGDPATVAADPHVRSIYVGGE
ncbi:ABC transporter ATP-binding protein [Spongiactinospora sp. TRM90649]|uniref:ABC transporter ATP-binding protein n=1 Tax=Spongiactinospora sp. TRM90649 TaxID=3031114 RepID=UPI0023F7F0D2|nr:ABC transporter ATP-binding protein [Spongiactinospora sp. TRM90649]MDF5758302.1 ABC transporter ATP-binding protein [Spongiactinospora sp. TRM90649]